MPKASLHKQYIYEHREYSSEYYEQNFQNIQNTLI